MRRLFLLLIVLSLVALITAPLTTLPQAGAIALLVLVSLHTWRRRSELGGEEAELILQPSGDWQLERGGKSLTLNLDGQTTVSHALLLLCFRLEDRQGRFECVLWRHEMPPQLYRQLQVYLKLYAQEAL